MAKEKGTNVSTIGQALIFLSCLTNFCLMLERDIRANTKLQYQMYVSFIIEETGGGGLNVPAFISFYCFNSYD